MLSCSLCEFLIVRAAELLVHNVWEGGGEETGSPCQLASSSFSFHPSPPLAGCCGPQPGLPHYVLVPHASHLWKAPHRYTQKCAFPVSSASFATAKLLRLLSILFSSTSCSFYLFYHCCCKKSFQQQQQQQTLSTV